MQNLGYRNVQIEDGFWKRKKLVNETVTINAIYDRFCDTGRIPAFACDWKEGMPNKPHIYWDSDGAKWMECASYILAGKDDPSLVERVEQLIDCIEKNQGADGYFNIYFTVCEPEKRFSNSDYHELYCAGTLIEAAIAYYEVTGRDRFLKCMLKYVDYIEKCFITEKTAAFTTPGHAEIELALIRLYRCTKNRRYLDMACFFIDNRGFHDTPINESVNLMGSQSHLPVREQKTAEGHAVRACYLYTAMADAAYECGDEELFAACKSIFYDIITRKMYITGGIGSTRRYEGFTIPYDLPNDTAFAETCAAVSLIFFAYRMQQLECNSDYADTIERVLYNGMLCGVSLDGKSFFYENPLEINLDNYKRTPAAPTPEPYAPPQRQEVFDVSCCPPNVCRVIASVGNYIYGYEKDAIYVNQFIPGSAEINGMKIRQETEYPLDGTIRIYPEHVKTLYVRIPSWCRSFTVNCDYELQNGYAVIRSPGELVVIRFAMEAQLIESDTRVRNNCGKAAVQYGPIVYCAESCDNIENLQELFLDKCLNYELEYSAYFGLYTLAVKGFRKISGKKLYGPLRDDFEYYSVKLIPYSCFANRGKTNMCVWMNLR